MASNSIYTQITGADKGCLCCASLSSDKSQLYLQELSQKHTNVLSWHTKFLMQVPKWRGNEKLLPCNQFFTWCYFLFQPKSFQLSRLQWRGICLLRYKLVMTLKVGLLLATGHCVSNNKTTKHSRFTTKLLYYMTLPIWFYTSSSLERGPFRDFFAGNDVSWWRHF